MEKKDNFIKRYNYVKDDIIKRLKELDCIEYGGDNIICRKIKRKSTQYKNDYRIWHDYAGDYRTK